jgi:N4-gp56 family major capsid protein
MSIQVVTATGVGVALSNSVRTQYVENYLEGAMAERLYDQISMPIGKNMAELKRGSSVQVEFLSDMPVATAAISEVTDITPTYLVDAVASVTPTSRGAALQSSQELQIKAFTDYEAKFAQRVGANAMESIDAVAQAAAVKGSFVLRGANAARGALDAGTTGHRASDTDFLEAGGYLANFKIPGFKDPINGSAMWPAIMHPYVLHDILKEPSGVALGVAQYQNQAMYFNHEVASLHGFRLVVSPWAKVFYGMGAANAGPFGSNIGTAITALATAFTTTGDTVSSGNGAFINIGTVETGDTHGYNRERVRFVSRSANAITIIGEGANGGFRFAHAAGTPVNNNDSVYTVVIGGPDSLVKVFAPEVGEYGEIVGPKKEGILDQWDQLGWKWWGGYGRLRENGLIRLEVSASIENV